MQGQGRSSGLKGWFEVSQWLENSLRGFNGTLAQWMMLISEAAEEQQIGEYTRKVMFSHLSASKMAGPLPA